MALPALPDTLTNAVSNPPALSIKYVAHQLRTGRKVDPANLASALDGIQDYVDAFQKIQQASLQYLQQIAGTDTGGGGGGMATGDVSGTLPGPLTVTGLQGRAVKNAAPGDGNVLAWSNASSDWEPTAVNPNITVLNANSSGGLTITTSMQDIPNTGLTLTQVGKWLILANVGLFCDSGTGGVAFQLTSSLTGAQPGFGRFINNGTGISSVTIGQSWIYTNSSITDVVKLQAAKLINAGTAGTYGGSDATIKAIYLHA